MWKYGKAFTHNKTFFKIDEDLFFYFKMSVCMCVSARFYVHRNQKSTKCKIRWTILHHMHIRTVRIVRMLPYYEIISLPFRY
jgi:GT2 family glycosyltransferase